YFLAARFDSKTANPQVLLLALKDAAFMQFFNSPQMLDTFLVAGDGEVAIRPAAQSHNINEMQWSEAVKTVWRELTGPELVKSVQGNKGSSFLVSASRIQSTSM